MDSKERVTSEDLAQMTHLTGTDRFPAVTVDEIDFSLFEGLNGGWPNRPDERTAMIPWKLYRRLDASWCTYCKRLGDDTKAVGYVARLIDNAKMDEGYIETRCPNHAADENQVHVRHLPAKAKPNERVVPDSCKFPNLHDHRLLCGCKEASSDGS